MNTTVQASISTTALGAASSSADVSPTGSNMDSINSNATINQDMLANLCELAVQLVDESPSPKMPKQERDEIPTLNGMGFMKIELEEFTSQFINDCKTYPKQTFLEIGCAYGFVTNKALESSEARIVALDLCRNHLMYMCHHTDKTFLPRLMVKHGKFPDDIEFPKSCFQSILAGNILHFLNPESFEAGLIKINNWLKMNGVLYLIAVTPQHYALVDKFEPVFTSRKQQGEKYPGTISTAKSILSFVSSSMVPIKDHLPGYLHVFDVDVLQRVLPEFGFRVEKIKYFDYASQDSKGQGHVGVVAVKVNCVY
jgi:SAM-dependent methyltransferase